MSLLLDGVTEDTQSSSVAASSPVLFTVTGNLGNGIVKVWAEIYTGGGYALAATYSQADPLDIFRCEFATGVIYYVELVGSSGEDINVTVADLAVS